jgi:glycosyltransferase involved in cell wall biosynthesis
MYGFVPFAQALSVLKGRYEFRVFLLCSSDHATLTCVDRLLEATGLKPVTTILTNVPPYIVHAVYGGADIILNAQQEPEIARGGFPGKTAEVLASGRPIITTLFSDLHKFYVDGVNCLIVRYDDIPSYIQSITRLFESPELRERLGRGGRATALASFEYTSGTYQLKQDLWETVQPPLAVEFRNRR